MKKFFTLDRKLNKIDILVLYFFIYAFIGWCIETVYCLYELGYFTKRGFLFGPICPIYGFGAIILIYFLSNIKKSNIKLFFASMVIFSIFEYMVGYYLEALYGVKCWDYSDKLLNLNGRISIFFSFAWGIFAILFKNHIHPFLKKQITKLFKFISPVAQNVILRSLILIFFVDFILTTTKHLA